MRDLESALIVPKTILTIAGRWPQHSPTIFSRLREIAFNSFELFMDLLVIADLFKLFNEFNFDDLFDMLSGFIPGTIHLFKIFLMKMQKEIWLGILEQLKTKHFNVYPKEFACVHDKPVNLAKDIGNLFQFGCWCTCVLYIIVPLFSDIDLPIRSTYFSEEYPTLMYILLSLSITVCGMTHSSIDVLTTNLIAIGVGQLNVLIEKINMFGTNDSEEKIDLGECVEHHIKIIKFAKKLNDVASGIILMEYFNSVLIVCFLGIQVMHAELRSLAFARISLFGVVTMLKLANYCIFANEILVKSTQVVDACYHSMWLDADKKNQQALMLIMERSKNPLFLTAGNFSIVSLKSFTTIMKSSYSYFAVMQTLYTKNENGIK